MCGLDQMARTSSVNASGSRYLWSTSDGCGTPDSVDRRNATLVRRASVGSAARCREDAGIPEGGEIPASAPPGRAFSRSWLVGEVSDSHLVVDDDRSIALAVRRALLAEGFAVDLATDGEEGRGR